MICHELSLVVLLRMRPSQARWFRRFDNINELCVNIWKSCLSHARPYKTCERWHPTNMVQLPLEFRTAPLGKNCSELEQCRFCSGDCCSTSMVVLCSVPLRFGSVRFGSVSVGFGAMRCGFRQSAVAPRTAFLRSRRSTLTANTDLRTRW